MSRYYLLKLLNNEKKIAFIIIAFSFLGILAVSILNLKAETLWFDESGQFFIAKGLNHFSPQFSQEGDVIDVIYNNARYNHDPGGFSILLHYWSMVSNNVIWLRLLPFCFFLLTVLFSFLIGHKVTGDKLYSSFFVFVPFFLIYCNYTYLLRPYSMELLCSVFGLWSIYWLKDKTSKKRLLVVSLVLSILMTSRYSAILIVFVYSCFISYLIYSREKGNIKKIMSSLLVYSIPLIVVLVLIWQFSLSIQNPGLAQLPHTISYRTSPFSFFNIFNVGLFLIFVVTINYWNYLNYNLKLFFIVLFPFELFFIIFSFKGSVPCQVTDLHCGYLLLVFWLFLFSVVYNFIKQLRLGYLVSVLVLVFTILSLHFQFSSKLTVSYKAQLFYHFAQDIKNIDLNNTPQIYVTYFFSPTVRFYYEYCKIMNEKEKNVYLNKFKFVDSYPHTIPKGKNPMERYKKTELNHLHDIKELPVGSIILGPYKMLIPMDHYSFSGIEPIPNTEYIFKKIK